MSTLPSAVTVGVGAGFAAAALVVRQRREAYSSLAEKVEPPALEKRPHMVPFGAVSGQNRGANAMTPVLHIEDPYFYVRDDTRKNAEVLEHLRKENEYTTAKTAHLSDVRETLYKELLSHVQETNVECPHPYGPYLYYSRTEKGSSYTFHCRKTKTGDSSTSSAPEELLLDENEFAAGHDHCDIVDVWPSPDHLYISFMVDYTGCETYTGYIKDLSTGQLLPDRLENVSALGWGKDSSEIFYGTQDEVHRQHKVWRHVVGSSEPDVCLYTEDDEVFNVEFWTFRSGKYMQFISSSSETTEISLLDLEDPSQGLQLVAKRETGVRYSLDHHGDYLYVVTNKDGATNFKTMRTLVSSPGWENWCDWFEYDAQVKVDSVVCFQDFLVICGREHGFSQLWVVTENEGEPTKHHIELDEDNCDVWFAVNCDYDTPHFRFMYSSMTTPRTICDLVIRTHKLVRLHEDPCPNCDRSLYESQRLEAVAPDGTAVPISIVFRKDLRSRDGPQPLHLFGYGAYEACMEPNFVASRLPLLDRGMVYAIAHIRGGGEKGRTWYESAKYTTKMTTFTDFIACAEHLIATGVTSASMLSCEGRSAGGLLMGAVLNMRPDLFTAALVGVPFVDVMNTMSDASIPLTTGEWEEWGNPNEAEYFHYMLRYSPYENITAQAYPSMLVTAGLHDPRVAYWEPTKWVARLRDLKTDRNDVLLKIDLSSGHFSASDRYHYLREKAFEHAFLLDQLKCVREADNTMNVESSNDM